MGETTHPSIDAIRAALRSGSHKELHYAVSEHLPHLESSLSLLHEQWREENRRWMGEHDLDEIASRLVFNMSASRLELFINDQCVWEGDTWAHRLYRRYKELQPKPAPRGESGAG